MKNDNLLYTEIMNICYDFVKNHDCYTYALDDNCYNKKHKASMAQFNEQGKIYFPAHECERIFSLKSMDYNCIKHPYLYILNRADRHASELIYAFKSTSEILKQMSEFRILELGSGPAMGLIAMDYYIKKYDNKVIHYLGIENNPIWEVIHDKIRTYSSYNNPKFFKIKEADITKELNIDFRPNVIILNYIVSWFYQKPQMADIDNLFKNVANIIDVNQPTVIIINDVNEKNKGVEKFIDIIDEIKNKTKKFTKLRQSFYISTDNRIKKTEYVTYGKDFDKQKETNTILRQDDRFDFWKILKGPEYENICTSAQMIITIGGDNDN